jgi:hypothetical protein
MYPPKVADSFGTSSMIGLRAPHCGQILVNCRMRMTISGSTKTQIAKKIQNKVWKISTRMLGDYTRQK